MGWDGGGWKREDWEGVLWGRGGKQGVEEGCCGVEKMGLEEGRGGGTGGVVSEDPIPMYLTSVC